MAVIGSYRKDSELQRRINAFLQDAFGLPERDYYAQMDLRQLLSLKSALSDINNALTMRLTLSFINWVAETLSFDAVAAAQLRDDVLGTKPSSNGYDVYCKNPVPFVAEVKCNIPVNAGTRYGAAQKIGITKDIDSLLLGKSKSLPLDAGALKFMVFIDLPAVRAANEHLLASSSRFSEQIRFVAKGEALNDPKVVYGVYAAFEA